MLDVGFILWVSWLCGVGVVVGDVEYFLGEEGYGSDLLFGFSNVGVEEEDIDVVDIMLIFVVL